MGEEMHPHFTKKTKRMWYEEIDNMVWSGTERETSLWCRINKVCDAITEDEIEEIWKRESPDDEVRLNGKYVWETAKRACDHINTRRHHLHHIVRRRPSCDDEGDDGNRGCSQR